MTVPYRYIFVTRVQGGNYFATLIILRREIVHATLRSDAEDL